MAGQVAVGRAGAHDWAISCCHGRWNLQVVKYYSISITAPYWSTTVLEYIIPSLLLVLARSSVVDRIVLMSIGIRCSCWCLYPDLDRRHTDVDPHADPNNFQTFIFTFSDSFKSFKSFFCLISAKDILCLRFCDRMSNYILDRWLLIKPKTFQRLFCVF